jgi:hypothetical protein
MPFLRRFYCASAALLLACRAGSPSTTNAPMAFGEPEPYFHQSDAAPVSYDSEEARARDSGSVRQAVQDAGLPSFCRSRRADPPQAPAQQTRASFRAGPALTNHIPAEVIQRPIRQVAACFAHCLQTTEKRDGGQARIAIRFVVDLDGYVRNARAVEYGDAPKAVADCVAYEIGGLSFPSPEGAPVTVVYPFTIDL